MFYFILIILLLNYSEAIRPKSAISDARMRIKSICQLDKYDNEVEEKQALCDDGVEIGGGAAETFCRRSVIRAAGYVKCENLLLDEGSIQKGCINSLSSGLNFPGKGWCLFLNEACCREYSQNVIKTLTPFCDKFAEGVISFTKGTCRLTRNIAIAGANDGCTESIKEAKNLATTKCYNVLGIK